MVDGRARRRNRTADVFTGQTPLRRVFTRSFYVRRVTIFWPIIIGYDKKLTFNIGKIIIVIKKKTKNTQDLLYTHTHATNNRNDIRVRIFRRTTTNEKT